MNIHGVAGPIVAAVNPLIPVTAQISVGQADGADGADPPLERGQLDDGGLLDMVLSPTFAQDRLMYAYISTPSDNRVGRIAEGDAPKDLLTGIPKGRNNTEAGISGTEPATVPCRANRTHERLHLP